MRLYHLTSIPPTAITSIAQGSFTAPKQQELFVSTGTSLDLYRLLPKDGRLAPGFRTEAFACIRCISAFRLPGTRRDYLIITSDSGTVTVLSADAATCTLRKIHCEVLGRSGCRRVVPGQFLTCEPRGRACMVSAIESVKFSYIFNRDADENLTISSPLESSNKNTGENVHSSPFCTYTVVGVDVGFENPVFAALERSYESDSRKLLVYYELDLGLNHIVRKHSSTVHDSSYVLIPVPGHTDGPSGVLVCSEGLVTYRNLIKENETERRTPHSPQSKDADSQPEKRLEARLPFRQGMNPETTMVVSGTTYHDKKGNAFFFMLCTEYGDLIKAELTVNQSDNPTELRLAYFDSLPAPVTSLTIFRSGYLFAALEGNDSLLLKFNAVDVPDDDPAGGISLGKVPQTGGEEGPTPMDIESSKTHRDAMASSGQNGKHDGDRAFEELLSRHRVQFVPREKLFYLSVVSSLECLAPILSVCNATDDDGGAKLLLASGKGRCGSIRGVRLGASVLEMSAPHPMPGRILDLFTFKDRAESPFHRFIVVSFKGYSKVLAVGDSKVEETLTSGFDISMSTLCAGQMGYSSLLQVHEGGVRFVKEGKADAASEWPSPVPTKILAASSNGSQVVCVLSSGAIVYFEIDQDKNELLEVERLTNVLSIGDGDRSVANGLGKNQTDPSVAIAPLPSGRRRASFFAVADGVSSKVRLYRFGNDGQIGALGIHLAPAPVASLALVDFGIIQGVPEFPRVGKDGRRTEDATSEYSPMLALVIGTKHGAVIRVSIDSTNGTIGDKRSMFLGPGSVKVKSVLISGIATCFALGSKSLLMHREGSRVVVKPLGSEPVENVASLASEEAPDGFVTTQASSLRLLSLELVQALQSSAHLPPTIPVSSVPSMTNLLGSFQLTRSRISGTPRRVVPVIEPDSQVKKPSKTGQKSTERKQQLFIVVQTDQRMTAEVQRSPVAEGEVGGENANTLTKQTIVIGKGPGTWYSKLQLVKVAAGGDGDTEEAGDEDDIDSYGSDPMVSLSVKATTVLDEVDCSSSNECIVTAACAKDLGSRPEDGEAVAYVVVSYACNLVVSASSSSSRSDRQKMNQDGQSKYGFLRVFQIDKSRMKLVKIHDTRTKEPVYAMSAFRDMIVAGVGNTLRLYALGKKQLLRKAEYRIAVQNVICALAVSGGDRIFVADIQESVTLFKYVLPTGLYSHGASLLPGAEHHGHFVALASDELSRWVTCLHVVDYSTVWGGDKFGNVFMLRLPAEVGHDGEELGGTHVDHRGGMSGAQCAPHKLRVEACMHVGSTVTSMTKCWKSDWDETEQPNGEPLIYTTMHGGAGILIPFRTKTDAEFGRKLEHAIRKVVPSLFGRDHVSYRSCFYSLRNIIDGDLCELIYGLKHDDSERVAKLTGRPIADVLRKLDELRTWSM